MMERHINGLVPKEDIPCPCAKVWLGTRGDDTCRWGAIGVAIGVLNNHLVLSLLGIEAPQQCAQGRSIDFVQTYDIGWALFCKDK